MTKVSKIHASVAAHIPCKNRCHMWRPEKWTSEGVNYSINQRMKRKGLVGREAANELKEATKRGREQLGETDGSY